MSTSVLPPRPSLWVRLPAVNRQRLLGRLSQLLERQLIKGDISGEEDGHESAPGE